jgi:hypothetical protein
MYKRKDWVFLRRGQGASGDNSSSSSESSEESRPESDDSASDSEEIESSMEDSEELSDEEEDGSILELAEEDFSAEEEEPGNMEEGLQEQLELWYDSGSKGKVEKGQALMCTICKGKRLLLNSVVLYQHVESKIHKKMLSSSEFSGEELIKYISYAKTRDENAIFETDAETHAERLERIKTLADKPQTKGSKTVKKRKPRPGKRQRESLKKQRDSA